MVDYQSIIRAIKTRNCTVAVIGLGYVGLPLLLSLHEKGFKVLGVDIDRDKIAIISRGESYIKHMDTQRVQNVIASERSEFSSDFSRIKDADVILICVPTPLTKQREPDMSFVVTTIKSIVPFLKPGHLIVLESTTYPGATEECVKNICEQASNFISGEDFFIAYSPEREDPGNTCFHTMNIPKVVGGDDVKALEIAKTLYEELVPEVVPVSNMRTAEAVKLMENIFRSVNIALVNELKMVFSRMNIDIHEVINAAKSKPFGFMPFYPGPGLGGHCIPIDPFYLTWKVREYGLHTRFVELAGEINTAMPHYVVQKVCEALNNKKMSVNGSSILCLGLAYKADIDDMRESPTFAIMDILSEQGASVDYYDQHIPVIGQTREHKRWFGKRSIFWNEESVRQYDAVIIVTDHTTTNYEELSLWSDIIIDTRNVFKNLSSAQSQIWQA